jgi:hypothetical protein
VFYTENTLLSVVQYMRRTVYISIISLVGAVWWTLFFLPQLLAASALEVAVGECKKRTGFGDSTCTTLIKKYMNVERCKEYTGYSEAECVQKIKEIQDDVAAEASGTDTAPMPSRDVVPSTILRELPPIVPRSDNSFVGLREKKERDLIALWKRTEAVTNILKDRGVDTQRVEAAFPEFERRAETLLGAYDTYRLVYERTSKDVPEARAAIRDDARQRVIQAKNDLLEQYQADILRLLRVAQEQGV